MMYNVESYTKKRSQKFLSIYIFLDLEPKLEKRSSAQVLISVHVNVKILILSYKISIFAFTKILLEQRYLEMISPLRNYFLLLCFFPCLDHCSYNITRAHNIMMYYVPTIIWNTKIVLSSSLWTWQLQYTSGISKIGYETKKRAKIALFLLRWSLTNGHNESCFWILRHQKTDLYT